MDYLLAKKKILVVEDNKVNMTVMQAYLEPFKENLICVDDGQKALDATRTHTDIGLVLLDLKLPIMDGYSYLETINPSGQSEALPFAVLVISELDRWQDAKRAIDLGALSYLQKPHSKEQLYQDCTKVLFIYRDRLRLQTLS